jgi:hypothetical protein
VSIPRLSRASRISGTPPARPYFRRALPGAGRAAGRRADADFAAERVAAGRGGVLVAAAARVTGRAEAALRVAGRVARAGAFAARADVPPRDGADLAVLRPFDWAALFAALPFGRAPDLPLDLATALAVRAGGDWRDDDLGAVFADLADAGTLAAGLPLVLVAVALTAGLGVPFATGLSGAAETLVRPGGALEAADLPAGVTFFAAPRAASDFFADASAPAARAGAVDTAGGLAWRDAAGFVSTGAAGAFAVAGLPGATLAAAGLPAVG